MHQIQESKLNLQADDPFHGNDGGLAVESVKPALKKPSLYSVIMMNDDYTPMEFVVEVLQSFFNKTPEQATQIMLTVHTKGSAVCAVYTKDVAETKAALVNQYARDCQHPLMCEISPAED
ncbi:MAG: ATP-dependent Clp protease adapter ClpS [Pseudomonadota bacterium]|nr:ATP-dependent Clp protease adapter ClpS [Pseudomonadota bacterium]